MIICKQQDGTEISGKCSAEGGISQKCVGICKEKQCGKENRKTWQYDNNQKRKDGRKL